MASVRMLHLLLLLLSVGRQSVSVSATVTAVSEPSVSAVFSVTAITGLQIRRQPEKVVSVGLLIFQLIPTRALPVDSAKTP